MKRSGHGRQWGIFFLVFGILLGLGGCKKETTETVADEIEEMNSQLEKWEN